MKEKGEKIAIRLVEILKKLNSGESFTAAELASDLKVTTRTIQRDINERLQNILPIKMINGRYQLEGFALGNITFKDLKNFARVSKITTLFIQSLTRTF